MEGRFFVKLSYLTAWLVLLLVCSSGAAAQVPEKKQDLKASDREEWRALLRWPDQCERGFREYQKNFPDKAGLEFFKLDHRKYLVQVLCSAGRVIFLRYPEGNYSQAHPIRFKEMVTPDGTSAYPFRVISYDEGTRVLWIYLDSQMGVCRFYKYSLLKPAPRLLKSGKVNCGDI